MFDANKDIIRDLKAAGRILRHQTIEHSYPHSWRSGQPLIYMALPSWFVAVTKFRDRMVELNHDLIEWMPEHIRDGQFGKWLEGARDWNISRNRYWGSPIPVWVSDSEEYPRVDVYGSLDELERDFGVRPASLHRPYIDELTRPNPDDPTGKSTMRGCRKSSTAGSNPAPCRSPKSTTRSKTKNGSTTTPRQISSWNTPANPAAGSIPCTCSPPPCSTPGVQKVVAHGIVLGDDGLKMSKSKGNYPNVNEVFDRDGSDAMRWFLMSSPILRGGNLIVTEQGIREGVRQALLPMWNAYSFLKLYSATPARIATDSTDILDRYILAKLHNLVANVTDALDDTDIARACDEVRWFCDVLTNWYVRRSRQRFWEGDEAHPEAFNTLYTVLEALTRVTAPLLPMLSEVIWRGLTGERSVHLADFPVADDFPADNDLVTAMDSMRGVCSATNSIRKAHKLRNRLPLPKLTVAMADSQQLATFADIIRSEVNVKELSLTDDVDSIGTFEVVVNAKIAGPRLGKDVQKAIKAVKAGNYERTNHGTVIADGVELQPDEFTERLVAADPTATAQIDGVDGLVLLDTHVTEELEAEGWAADVIRGLQDARKLMDLEVSDRITVTLGVPAEKEQWALRHADTIAGEVLATSLDIIVGDIPDGLSIVSDVTAAITKN